MTAREEWQRLPIDPDVEADEAVRPASGWPRLPAAVLSVVFAGGCVGGYARYALGEAWGSAAYAFPWATFAVNVAGAFVLAAVVVLAAQPRAPGLLRPLLGTGFCGALTTFGAVVVAAAQMLAHGHAATAAEYVAATVVASLLAVWIGLTCGRAAVGDSRAAA